MFGQNVPLLVRFIDDTLLIAPCLEGMMGTYSPFDWKQFKTILNDYDILKWDINALSVTYLDFTISIEDGLLITKTYRKPTNLYQ